MISPSVGIYGVIERSEEGWEQADSVVQAAKDHLTKAGLNVFAASELVSDDATALKAARELSAQDPDLLVAVIVCWSFDNLTLTILRHIDRPVAIIAIPGIRSGSIVGSQQLGCVLTEMAREHSIFYGSIGEERSFANLVAYAKAAAVKRWLEKGKIGNVGRRTPGMTPIAFDEMEITRLFGPQVVNYGWDEIENVAKDIAEGEVNKCAAQIRDIAASCIATEEGLADSARMYLALRQVAREEGLIAWSLGCYPLYAGRVCTAAGLLADDGIPTSCEGDMNSGLAMCLLYGLTGEPAHFGEVLEVDEKNNGIVTSHCGCGSPSLAADAGQIAITPVRL